MGATLPPGPRTPALWNVAAFARRPLDQLLKWQERYGNVVTVRMAGFGTGVYIGEPAAIKELFTGDQSDLLAGEANAILEPVLGPHSVLVLDGPEHLRQRRLMLPPFQGSHVNEYRQIIREVAEREVDRWQPGERIVVRQRMRDVTFEVISRVVFGVADPARVARLRTALMAVIDTGSIFLAPKFMRTDLGPWSPGGKLARRLRAADALLREEIELRRREPDLEDRSDVLSLLLRARDEDGNAMTDHELRDELFTMLGAGHETTSTGLAFAVDLLLREPRTLARLREELADPDDRYLDAVVKETLRLRPIIDAVQRKLTVGRTVAGWDLPAGIKAYPAIVLVHFREDLYPAAREFRPERFLDEGAESYTWLPFGGGIRRCIGAALAQAEMAEVLRVVVTRAELELERSEPEPIVLRGITLVPKHGVPVRVGSVQRSGTSQPGREALLRT
jgi:cytochrome P450